MTLAELENAKAACLAEIAAAAELGREVLGPVLPADLVAVDDGDRDDALRVRGRDQALRHVRPVGVEALLRELVALEPAQRRRRAARARDRVAQAQDAPDGIAWLFDCLTV